MKTGIFICLLTVLLYHETLCDDEPLVRGVPLVGGLCNSVDDLPSSLRNTCKQIWCFSDDSGNMGFLQGDCVLEAHGCGKKFTYVQNPEATYPDCCHRIICT